MIWFFVGGILGFIVCALFAGGKEDSCDTCKYRKIGVNAFSGEMQEPCNQCCHKYQDHYEEITL